VHRQTPVSADSLAHDFAPSEEVLIAMPPEVPWPILSSPATVALWILGAVPTKSGEGDIYREQCGEDAAES